MRMLAEIAAKDDQGEGFFRSEISRWKIVVRRYSITLFVFIEG